MIGAQTELVSYLPAHLFALKTPEIKAAGSSARDEGESEPTPKGLDTRIVAGAQQRRRAMLFRGVETPFDSLSSRPRLLITARVRSGVINAPDLVTGAGCRRGPWVSCFRGCPSASAHSAAAAAACMVYGAQ